MITIGKQDRSILLWKVVVDETLKILGSTQKPANAAGGSTTSPAAPNSSTASTSPQIAVKSMRKSSTSGSSPVKSPPKTKSKK